ncbi:MAG: hypothetical protein MUF38_13025 [Anaerolineae bacterium]|jgi:hypothetical protein|nr:hypothetical protein [Anaerolineae bacterium]
MSHHNLPGKQSLLADWFSAAGVESNREVIEVAHTHGITPVPWSEAQIAAWLGETPGRPGLPNLTVAVQMIATLRFIARRNGKLLFNREDFIDHANLFLASPACSFYGGTLTDDQVWDILGRDDDQPPSFPVWSFELRRRVYPRPPDKLFGRTDAQRALVSCLESSPAVALVGVGGEGKTALGWYGAVQAVTEQLCYDMAWFTDKRYLIDLHGKRVDIPGTPSDQAFFEEMLRGLAVRFRWSDVMGAVGDNLINKCADRLRVGRYLVVVDNLETVEASATVARQLVEMVVPHGLKAGLASRVLFTSRQQVGQYGCTDLLISGLSVEASTAYLHHLVAGWRPDHPLSAGQATALAHATKGNPQLLLIAARRWAQRLDHAVIDETITALSSGRDDVLGMLFDPLIEALSAEAPVFARLIAQACVNRMEVSGHELADLYRAAGLAGKFDHLTNELIDHCVLSPLNGGRYTMHPLVRAYLVGGGEG